MRVADLSLLTNEDSVNFFQSARELTAATWGQDLAIVLKQTNILIQDPEEEQRGSKADRQNVYSFGMKIKTALRDIWTDHATDVFDIGLVSRFIFSPGHTIIVFP